MLAILAESRTTRKDGAAFDTVPLIARFALPPCVADGEAFRTPYALVSVSWASKPRCSSEVRACFLCTSRSGVRPNFQL